MKNKENKQLGKFTQEENRTIASLLAKQMLHCVQGKTVNQVELAITELLSYIKDSVPVFSKHHPR